MNRREEFDPIDGQGSAAPSQPARPFGRGLSPKHLRLLINFWPPLLFAGIRVRKVAQDWRRVEAELHLRWWNRNALGSMFGGSLFSMTDPFYPLMLQHHLGPDYAVWTKSAEIEFLRPGKSLARATFCLSDDQIAEIKAATADGEKLLPRFSTEITDPQGETIAQVECTIYVRKKRPIS